MRTRRGLLGAAIILAGVLILIALVPTRTMVGPPASPAARVPDAPPIEHSRAVEVNPRGDVPLGEIRGVVSDPSGRPVAGATVRAFPRGAATAGTSPVLLTSSGTSGSFVLTPVSEEVQLEVSASGYGTDRRIASPGSWHRVTLEPAAGLSGRVFLLPEKRPCAGQAVVIRGRPDLWWTFQPGERDLESVTDAEGGFAFKDLRYGFYEMSVARDGYAPFAETGVWVGRGESVAKHVYLFPAVLVSGRVVDRSTDRPVPGATIRLVDTPALGARSGEDGRYALRGVLPGTTFEEGYSVQVEAVADGYAPNVQEVFRDPAGGDVEGNFSLDPGAGIAGRVVDTSEAPVAGAAVVKDLFALARGGGAIAVSGDDGSFVLRNLSPGAYRPCARKEGMVAAQADQSVRVAAGELSSGVRIILTPGVALSGTVLSDVGTPVEGANVSFGLRQEPRSQVCFLSPGHVLTDSRGRFRIDRVLQGSAGALSAYHPDFRPVAVEDVRAPDEGELAGIVIRLAPGQRVSGTVIDARGQPLAGVTVDVVPLERVDPPTCDGDAEMGIPQVVTDSEGVFVTIAVPRGTYRLDCTGCAPVLLKTGDEPPVIRRTANGAIEGRVVEATSGERATAFVVKCRSDRGVDGNSIVSLEGSDGAFLVEGLEAGTWHVQAADRSGRVSDPVAVAVSDGAVAHLELTLAPGGSVKGQVFGVHGGPLDHASVEIIPLSSTPPPRSYGAEADGAGCYRRSALPAGWYRLEVRVLSRTADYAMYAEAVVVSGHEVEIDIRPSLDRAIAVTVLDPDGGAAARVLLTCRDKNGSEVALDAPENVVRYRGVVQDRPNTRWEEFERMLRTTDASGHALLRGLAVGEYVLHAVAPDGAETSATVEVKPSGVTQVHLRLSRR